MNYLSIFAERLKDLMIERELDSESLTLKIGLDASGLRKYLRQEVFPSAKNALNIADFFDCRLDYLFGLSEIFVLKNKKSGNPFSENFKTILLRRNVSRYKFCADTGISEQSVADWFHSRREPSMSDLIKTAEYFDCSIDFLLGRE